MKKASLMAGFSLLVFLGVTHTAEARNRFVFSFGLGVPVYVPYGYYPPVPVYYCPPYPAACPPYDYYGPRYAAPLVTFYGGTYYGPRAHRRDIPRYGYVRGHVPPGHAYGHYKSRGYRRR